MRHGRCPKCDSQRIHQSNVRLPNWSASAAIPITASVWWGGQIAPIQYYVCVSCGYVESYITDRDKLLEIAAHWPQVTSQDA